MERFVIPLERITFKDINRVGGKAANLGELISACYNVPNGFCITVEAYHEFIKAAYQRKKEEPPRFSLKITGEQIESIRETLLTAEFPAAISTEISQAVLNLRQKKRGFAGVDSAGAAKSSDCYSKASGRNPLISETSNDSLAVRSSSTVEDRSGSSFAGQHDSYLNVKSRDVIAYVRRCWASLWKVETVKYFQKMDIPRTNIGIGIIVQQMIPAEISGILFTVNPVSGREDEMVINSSFGLGEAIVSGKISPDNYIIDKTTLEVIESQIGTKSEKAIAENNGSGTRQVRISRKKKGLNSLDTRMLIQLSQLGREIEAYYNNPRDIEWAIHQGTIFILQSRPVTSWNSPYKHSLEKQQTLWCNVNIGEALPGVGTPLTWSIALNFSEFGFEKAFGAMGLSIPKGAKMVDIINGRIYLNLTQLLEIASQFPFIKPEDFFKLGSGMKLDRRKFDYRVASIRHFLQNLPVTLVKNIVNLTTLPIQTELFRNRFQKSSERFEGLNLQTLLNKDLQREFQRLKDLLYLTGGIMLSWASSSLVSFSLLSGLTQYWFPHEVNLDKRLMTGLSGLDSAELSLGLWQLSKSISRDEALKNRVQAMTEAQLLSLIRSGECKELTLAYDEFMKNFGHRGVKEAELMTPRWSEDPSFVFKMIQKYCVSPELNPEKVVYRQYAARRDATAYLLKHSPAITHPLFKGLLFLAQKSARARERIRSDVTAILGMYRRLSLQAGRRMVMDGYLKAVEEVFFLEIDEIESYLEGSRVVPFKKVVQSRTTQFYENCLLGELPAIFSQADIQKERGKIEPDLSSHFIAGMAGSPGVVTGVARVILDPNNLEDFNSGDILVAPFTDIGWTPIFLLAAAVVMDRGGPLSHSTIVAREYGIPAVVNTLVGTKVIHSGQKITVDGNRGIVTLV